MGKHNIFKTKDFYTNEETEAEKMAIREQYEDMEYFIRECPCGHGEVRWTDKEIEDFVEDRFYNEECEDWDDVSREFKNYYIPGKLIFMGKVGRWNGTFNGYKILEKDANSLISILDMCGNDSIEIYVDDADNEIHYNGAHHDGSNCGIIRYIPNSVTEEDEDRLTDALYNNQADAADLIERFTRPLGMEIQNFYGWGKLPDGWKSEVFEIKAIPRKQCA
jgi:hypothetical protein